MKQLYPFLICFFCFISLSAFSQAEFVQNTGQWNNEVLFKARIPSGNIFIEKDKVTYALIHPEDYGFNHGHKDHAEEAYIKKGRPGERTPRPDDHPPKKIRGHAYNMTFQNANKNANVSGSLPHAHTKNYFIGNDKSKWTSNVKSFNQVVYQEIYKGVDVKYFAKNDKLKYDLYIAPGADPAQIKLQYDGADELTIENNKLIIKTSVNTTIESIPEAFQVINGKKKQVKCLYVLDGDIVSFNFPDGYNSKYELIIDPVVDFASFTGSTADNWGFTATYDDDGNLYAGGIAFGVGYPVTTGAFDQIFNGLVDVSISKFSADGKTLIYSTYLGGNETETPNSMIVNSKGELVIYGVTGSANFPVTPGAFQSTFKGGWDVWFLSNNLEFFFGTDIFITVLGKNGDQLTGSTFYGGTDTEGINDMFVFNYSDEFRGEVIVDEQDNIYVASSTWSLDLPVTSNAFKNSGDFMDACIFKLSPDCSNLIFSSYYGSWLDEAGFSLKHDSKKNLFVAGGTSSSTLPATSGAYISSGNDIDGFITKIDSNWNIIRTTFIGTNVEDISYLLDIDQSDKIYTTGITYGVMPITANVFNNANSGQFIMKLNNDLTAMEVATVFGKSDFDPELSATAFMIDVCGNIYYSGWGGGTNEFFINDFLIHGLTVTPDAMKPTTDGSDFYYIILAPDADSLIYASYFGGNISQEHVDGGTSRFDKKGIIYQGICAGCGGLNDFPTTPGVYSAINGTTNTAEPNCNMGVAKISFEVLKSEAKATVEPGAVGCADFEVIFGSTSNADNFWDFDNGQTSTEKHPKVIFTQPGIYNVSLIVTDKNSCNQISTDTLYIPIEVLAAPVASFALPATLNLNQPIKIDDQSTGSLNSSYTWNFGNGATSSEKEPEFTLVNPGTYNVCLTLVDSISGCSDVACKTIDLSENYIVDVPNAFTPNSDGKNDILYVKGEGVGKVRFRVYNRWGELLFESIDISHGWDGIYKGLPQDMDTYIYYLDATLLNGEEVNKKGNITLIR